jgi:thiamine-phosphate pyrophosphorylase
LVLHNHYDLGKDSEFQDFISGRRRPKGGNINLLQWKISTSVHDITTFNALGKEWEYAFISPFFPSISKKGYGEDSTVIEEMKDRNNKDVKLIALGGIHPENINRFLMPEQMEQHY